MAPRTLAEYIGQRHILAEGKMLRRMIESDQMSSIILFGPPGSGKTSLARVIAQNSARPFYRINAVTSGVADIKAVIADSRNPFICPEGKAITFIDEIHRFNKAQQDALLPAVEEGSVILIGATTENPFFEVNKALLSRSTVFQLYPLSPDEIGQVIDQALADEERGYGQLSINLDPAAREFLQEASQGDARVALRALELAVTTTPPNSEGTRELSLEIMGDCLQQSPLRYDKDGEGHYDTISAFIKSMRGSDPDAALHYLARMLESGEDLNFIARRIVICAAEDVGLANPQILGLCMSAWDAVRAVGMPEARIILAQAVVLVASSPKSNSAYLAIDEALRDVRKGRLGEIPYHLRNAPVEGMANLSYGEGYLYSHDFPLHVSKQEYLPPPLRDKVYYEPGDLGYEKQIQAWLAKIAPYLGK
ncbi:MAG: replication-associated recombination protein A [Eubacteriales bacterium]|nr:replication-associated recombination protein A [Eubacteriales bacterium]